MNSIDAINLVDEAFDSLEGRMREIAKLHAIIINGICGNCRDEHHCDKCEVKDYLSRLSNIMHAIDERRHSHEN